ncbi:glycosyltransferase family 2 protein [Pseudofulvibacter geojedonensis]|uniref:Glycosyltransferase family 2 protein n=1 Tax=Pseudofulvibacter geojedonensis TaxID=1123758 RepID=A0ABW3HZB8_9FLAO
MKFSLIVCTYMRPKALITLLESVKAQSLYPNEILIIDGSINDDTKKALELNVFNELKYFKVLPKDRGLTKQRNFGIAKVDEHSEIICFLDDDTILETNYFKNIISTYNDKPDALAVGGYITNEVSWKQASNEVLNNEFYYDGWVRKDSSRFLLRKKLGLIDKTNPGFMPTFSNGRPISFLPPSNKIYQVEQFMGGVSSFRKQIFEEMKFSTYFEGYGLYEDADFSLRLAKKGKLYVNTSARLEHHHDESGRPNQFKYGKMVLRNGWYVWRVKYINPSLTARFKWNAIALLLTLLRFTNVITTNKKKEAFTEALGRVYGWFSLLFNKPSVLR